MNTDTSSPWTTAEAVRSAAPLESNPTCDVCVVGGGIAGLTTAYLLAKEGKRVAVLDAKPLVASGETEVTTAHLAWYIDDSFSHLASVRGDDVAKAAAASHRGAIDLIEEVARTENIECDFKRVDGTLVPGVDGPEALGEEEQALKRLGLEFNRTRYTFPAGQAVDALRFPGHAQFHPIKYLAGLTAALRNLGVVIHTNTVVETVRGGEPCKVTTTHGHTVSAGVVVIATNNPFEAGTPMHNKVAAYTTYALAVEVPKDSFTAGLLWDTEDPYHYVRVQPAGGHDLLIAGGEDHKTGQAEDQPQRWDRLLTWTKERFPQAGAVKHHWSGQVFETPDGLGFIGLAPWNGPNVYMISGDSGMGLTHGTLGARLVTDLAQGRVNDLADVYSPSRLVPGAMKTLLGENLNMVAQFSDWVTGGDVKRVDDIPPGQGAIVRSGLTKLAVYKDEKGSVTTLSATCPHMGAVVRWNAGEATWDCPCHGSRFKADGTCVHGPATFDLKAAE